MFTKKPPVKSKGPVKAPPMKKPPMKAPPPPKMPMKAKMPMKPPMKKMVDTDKAGESGAKTKALAALRAAAAAIRQMK